LHILHFVYDQQNLYVDNQQVLLAKNKKFLIKEKLVESQQVFFCHVGGILKNLKLGIKNVRSLNKLAKLDKKI
jgi:hypothetical protein